MLSSGSVCSTHHLPRQTYWEVLNGLLANSVTPWAWVRLSDKKDLEIWGFYTSCMLAWKCSFKIFSLGAVSYSTVVFFKCLLLTSICKNNESYKIFAVFWFHEKRKMHEVKKWVMPEQRVSRWTGWQIQGKAAGRERALLLSLECPYTKL